MATDPTELIERPAARVDLDAIERRFEHRFLMSGDVAELHHNRISEAETRALIVELRASRAEIETRKLECKYTASMMAHEAAERDKADQALITARVRIDEMEKALREVVKGEGEFSRDPLQHASNTIESMKEIARAALQSEKKE